MQTVPNHCRMFSTDMLPERDRYDSFCEEMARQVMRLDIRRNDYETPFFSRFVFADLGRAQCGAFDFSPAAYGRTRELMKDGNDDFVLLVNRGGLLHENRRDSALAAGAAVLQNNSCPAYITTKEVGCAWNVVVPRRTLARLLPAAEDMIGASVDANSTALRLLRGYVSTLLEDVDIDPQTLAAAGDHIAELTALALSSAAASAVEGARAARKAARRLALQRDIRMRVADPALTLEMIAKAHGISERYLQRLLEEQGTSFTDYVRELRLALAYRELLSPAHQARRISDIAFGAGFSDLSYFNRCFRRRYGATPSDVRRARQ